MINNTRLVGLHSFGYYLYQLSCVLFISISTSAQDSSTTGIGNSDTLSPGLLQGAQMPASASIITNKKPDYKKHLRLPKPKIARQLPGMLRDSLKLYVHRKKPKPDEVRSQQLGKISFWAMTGAYVLAFLTLEVVSGPFSTVVGIAAVLLAIAGLWIGIKSLNGDHKTQKSRTLAMLGFFFSLMMLVALAAAWVIWMYIP